MHKELVRVCRLLAKVVHEYPDSVIIAYTGKSNGTGPMLAAQSCVPVVTVPADWRNCHEDVWSSLRTPKETPVMTVLDPANAVHAALEMLGMRNPSVYAQLHMQQEKRLVNN